MLLQWVKARAELRRKLLSHCYRAKRSSMRRLPRESTCRPRWEGRTQVDGESHFRWLLGGIRVERWLGQWDFSIVCTFSRKRLLVSWFKACLQWVESGHGSLVPVSE